MTSPTGAAIRDILHVLKRRYPVAPVIVYPTLVQGELAAANIVNAIQTANHRNECDVIILARGGGSIEDLWPFNEEIVANAIHASIIPIISGVGHEIDFTIADFVADVRAPTPSAAAEMVSPAIQDLANHLSESQKYLERLILQKHLRLKENLTWMQKHLFQQHPKRRLKETMQSVDLLEAALIRLQFQKITTLRTRLHTEILQFQRATPLQRIRDLRSSLQLQKNILENTLKNKLVREHDRFIHLTAKLNALSPLATINRGFAIATIVKDKSILRAATDVKPGDKINLKVSAGEIFCTVDKTKI